MAGPVPGRVGDTEVTALFSLEPVTLSTEAIVFLVGTTVIAAVFGWISYLRVQIRTLGHRLESGQSKLRAYATELIRAEEEERARVSRELHDGVGQLIAALNLELETMRAEAPETLQPRIDDLRSLTNQLGTDVRRMSHELRPAILDELGLHEALAALTRRMSHPPRLIVDLNVRGNLIVLPADLRLTCYRVVQEALTNVVKHSGASRAEVHVDLDGHALRLAIADNGQGLPGRGDGPVEDSLAGTSHWLGPGAAKSSPAESTGFGLLGLRERVEAVGGSLRLGRAELGGALVAAELPVG
jgi:signal transduction histidine kinase